MLGVRTTRLLKVDHTGIENNLVARLKALPPGSVYTEPAGQAHFSQTGDEAVVILVTGYGPSDTKFVTN